MGSAQSRGRESDVLLICVNPPLRHHCILTTCAPSFPLCVDADDQTGAVQGPRAAGAELGAFPAQVPPQESDQAQGAQEEERQERVHALPALAARQQGTLGRVCVCVWVTGGWVCTHTLTKCFSSVRWTRSWPLASSSCETV